ncbi:MAG: methyltransferase domain-containing protein [Hyphomicrobiales bacterium]|nr:methyltransferase domain-containing protein [Hyphomicrobiales bacterium]
MLQNKPDWSKIGDREESNYYVDYLDTVTHQDEIRRYKQKTYRLLGLKAGDRVLDAGCGAGDDVIAMAEIVGPGGLACGLDYSAGIVAQAEARAAEHNLSTEFRQGDVQALPFDDDSFDAVRADRVFMHIEDRGKALAEMVRVARPGGRVLVREPDWDSLLIDSDDKAITRSIIHAHFDQVIRHGWAGRALYSQFRSMSLQNIAVGDCSTLMLTDFALVDKLYGLSDAAAKFGAQTPEMKAHADQWLADLKTRNEQGRFFSAITGFTVIGLKPERAE